MKRLTTLATSCAFMAATAFAAQADCAEDLESLTGGSSAAAQEGISKDGSLAPLQGGDSGSSASSPDMPMTGAESTVSGEGEASTDDGEIAKDGSVAPLEAEGMGAGTAMSGQDAQAQQDESDMAAQVSPEREALIEEARNALAAGVEEACQAALEEAAQL